MLPIARQRFCPVRLLNNHAGWTLYADDKRTTLTHEATQEVIDLDKNFAFKYSHMKNTTLDGKAMTRKELAKQPGLEFAANSGNGQRIYLRKRIKYVDVRLTGTA